MIRWQLYHDRLSWNGHSRRSPFTEKKFCIFFLFNSLFSLGFKKCMRYWLQTKQKLNFWMLEDLSILKAIEGGTGGVWILTAFCYIYIYKPYLFTSKVHSVTRRTLNFRRRLWQVSEMKISRKYPVIRRTWNYGNFVDRVRCTYNNLLPKVDSYSAPILKTKAKKSHITNNSKKVTHGK